MIKDRRDLDVALARLDAAAEAREDFREQAGFYRAVLQFLFQRREPGKAVFREISGEEARLRVGEGFPLLDQSRLDPDPAVVGESFDGLLDLAGSRSGLDQETVRTFRSWRRAPDVFVGLVTGFLRGGDPGGQTASLDDDAREALQFLLHASLRPIFESIALAYGDLEALQAWERGSCPICGGGPALETFLGEEGRRMLLCHRCGHGWGFRRVRCPFCDNTEQEKLRYLYFGPESMCRIDVCDACRGYLKGFDTRHAPRGLSPEAEDLVTPEFDLVAVREGYERKAPNILGLWR